MISIPLIDELRATRRQLAEQCGCDVDRYAEMLQQVSERLPGRYLQKPLVGEPDYPTKPAAEHEIVSAR